MSSLSINSQLPDSVLPYPKGLRNKIKYAFWKGFYPFHNGFRNLFLKLHILHHEGRQNYVFGKLAPGRDPEAFLKFLESQGFGNHFIAWKDDGEIVSIRKLVSFEQQYHIRLFEDGEVRGHFEYTPECYPFWHFKECGQEARREEILNFLGDWVTPSVSTSEN
jgi:hypothetical protein